MVAKYYAIGQISERLIELFKTVSLSAFKDLTSIRKPELKNAEKKQAIYNEHMIWIPVFTDVFHIILKTYFMTNHAREFAACGNNTTVSRVSKAKAMDFLAEYCNLAAGLIQRKVEQIVNTSEIGLPITVKAFDELFAIQTKNRHYEDYWQIYLDANTKLFLSTIVEIIDEKEYAKLPIDKLQEKDNEQKDDDMFF